VHVVELSNHPEAKRRRLQQERQKEQEAVQARYEEALAEHHAYVESLRSERRNARTNRRFRTWLTLRLAVRRAQQAPPERPRIAIEASDEEEILSAGARGEQIAVSRFESGLNSDWYLFRGYRNRGGEIDQLLVGPTGLYAVEVKYLNAIVECEGDEWWSQRYDKYGNLMRQGAIVDGGGRSPSQQVNTSADALEQFLGSRGHAIPIRRIVLLTHPNSMVAYCGNQTVDLVTDSTDDVLAFLQRSRKTAFLVWSRSGLEPSPTLGGVELTDIERLIVRDHHHHNSRGSRRGSR